MRNLAADCLMLALCWSCYQMTIWSPVRFGIPMPLLPFAGQYAYSDGWAAFREVRAWNRAGQPDGWEWRHH